MSPNLKAAIATAPSDEQIAMWRELAEGEADRAERAVAKLEDVLAVINHPMLKRFFDAAQLEASHAKVRWGERHDANKTPWDWWIVVLHLSHKAMIAHEKGDHEKALHHTISSAGALANWHEAVLKQRGDVA